MSRTIGSLILALGLSLTPAAALADLAGGPPGTGGGGAGGASGGGGDGGSGGSGGKTDGGGCVTATPGAATRSAALVVGLGLLFAIPAARARRPRKPR